jgi:hypothetical protein
VTDQYDVVVVGEVLVELASDRHRVGPLPVAACLLIVCALTVGLVNQAGL